ncbi:double-stranded RNA-binding protein 1-like [Mangifera indica]|uniref:double-stranded RNA-binding protein 1-like n=1 Tax=Mangifera indica TaxID=29780 RepID=UPI001CFAA305|nr:double-stranded RNA-binding protein 1-like [Mangifera indica]
MPTNEGFSALSNCYLFKSRLQEYAQKMGLPTPVYETTKDGPSHEPSFRSVVVVNYVRYESLPGFFNRKAAEQSAAEVALLELAELGQVNPSISQPVHETGLCKNLLQEYAQKMNYAIPMYQCRKDEAPGQVPQFSCTVEVGGIQYIGATARTKKEAEIKAARTVLLASQSSASELSGKPIGNSQLTVIPCRKRGSESADRPQVDKTLNVPKPKKARFKKKTLKKPSRDKASRVQVHGTNNMVLNVAANLDGSQMGQTNASGIQVVVSETMSIEAARNFQGGRLDVEATEGKTLAVKDPSTQNGHSTALKCNQSVHEATLYSSVVNSNQSGSEGLSGVMSYVDTPALAKENSNQNSGEAITFVPFVPYGDSNALAKELNETTRVEQVSPPVNNPIMSQIESSCVVPGLN